MEIFLEKCEFSVKNMYKNAGCTCKHFDSGTQVVSSLIGQKHFDV